MVPHVLTPASSGTTARGCTGERLTVSRRGSIESAQPRTVARRQAETRNPRPQPAAL